MAFGPSDDTQESPALHAGMHLGGDCAGAGHLGA
jgi:hypothetical protein